MTVSLDPTYGCGTTTCIYTITFLKMNANLPLITVDATFTEGNELWVEVEEVQAGQAAAEIAQSPFSLTVMPNTTSAAYSEAYGQGLTQGTTGATSVFTIQVYTHTHTHTYTYIHPFLIYVPTRALSVYTYTPICIPLFLFIPLPSSLLPSSP